MAMGVYRFPRWPVCIVALLYINTVQCIVSERILSTLEQNCVDYTKCRTDVNRALTSNDTKNAASCCLPCSCDVSTCQYTHNCCPELNENAIIGKNETTQLLECKSPSINLDNKLKLLSDYAHSASLARLGIVMVTRCEFVYNETRCLNPNASSLEENVPVTSIITGVTYRNKFCAECNNVNESETLQWTAYVTCSKLSIVKASDMLFPNSAEKMFMHAIESKEKNCGFDFMPPENIYTKPEFCFETASIVSNCPQNYSDVEIVNACSSIQIPYMRTDYNATIVYANYFCYLCNVNVIENEDRCPENVKLVLHEDNDYVAEVNANATNESKLMPPWLQTDLTPAGYIPEGVRCNGATTYDPFEDKCREWYCPSGRELVDGECIPTITDVVKASYTMALKLKPDILSKDDFISVNKTYLTHEVLNQMFGQSSDIKREIIILSIRDDFSYLYTFVLVSVTKNSKNKSMIFDQSTYGNDVTVSVYNYTLTVTVEFAIGVKLELSMYPLSDSVVIDLVDYVMLRNIYRANITDIEKSFQYTSISKLEFCTQFLLKRNQLRDYIDILDIRISDTRIHIGEFARTSKFANIHVCVKDYLRHAAAYIAKKNKRITYSPQAILSVICILLSIAGLVFTIVTYITFDELRSVPGKNNMMLAFHLLLAQCLYQFGMDQTDKPQLCVILGIFIHLFYLIAIFWMNACTLHMFRTFVTGQSYRSVRAFDPQVCCYAVYCYGIAMAMVAVNLCVSIYNSDGKDLGYGGHVCYISNPVMVGWVFALPVGVIVILNMGFFFAVVYQISASTMRRRGKSTDRANTVIYMKLSSLTGVTWIFGYLYLWTDFTPFEYIFIVLNAGQGVFIFISFICTQRIVKLYRNLFHKKCLSARASVCQCCCIRKGFESEINGLELNTAKTSLADTTTKRRTTGKKKKRVLKLSSSHTGSKSDSVSETPSPKPVGNPDMYKESMQMARAIINQGSVGARHVGQNIDVESLNNLVKIGVQNSSIATIGLEHIDFIPANNN